MSDTQSPASTARLESVLHTLTAQGEVNNKMRQSAQSALAVVPLDEDIIDAYRCSILSGTAGTDGVAVLSAERLSVFERRGFRSPDQKLLLSLARPFTIEPGPGATRLTLSAPGGRPTTLELFEAERAEGLRDELAALRSAREAGWWSSASVAWPEWLGAAPTWSYLGGDPKFPRPALDLRLHVGPTGFTLGDSDGSTAHLAPWSAVSELRVVGHEQAVEWAAARTLLVSSGFAAAWRAAEWSAFIVVGYSTGEQVFLGTTELSEAELRNKLFRVAAAMPSGQDSPPPLAGEPPAEARPPVVEHPQPVPAIVASLLEPAPAPEEPQRTVVSEPETAYSLVEQLERLGALHRQGVLDDAEFARAKAAVLNH